METITIDDKEFQYQIFWYDSDLGAYAETVFYQGTKTETYRKYLFFGAKIMVEVPIEVFKFQGNIKSNYYTKQELKQKLEKKVNLLGRQAEIDRGELI